MIILLVPSSVFLCYQQVCSVPWEINYKDIGIASLLMSLFSTLVNLLASPLYVGSLSLLSLFVLFVICSLEFYQHLYFYGGRGVPTYWEKARTLFLQRLLYSSEINVLTLIFLLSLLYSIGSAIKTPFNCNTDLRNGDIK